MQNCAEERVLLVEEGRLGELLDQNLTGSGLAGVLVSMNGASMSGEGPRTWEEATKLLWREIPMPIQAASGKDLERLTEKAEGNAAMVRCLILLGSSSTAPPLLISCHPQNQVFLTKILLLESIALPQSWTLSSSLKHPRSAGFTTNLKCLPYIGSFV